MFSKDKQTKDGFSCYCKQCRKKYYQTHKIEIIKCIKRYRQTEKGKQAHNQLAKKYKQTIAGYLRYLFQAMKYRCNNPKCKRYKDWGGRGIRCLFKSSQEFVNYIIEVLKIDPRGLTIDRIDNNGHYESGNIRFITIAENNRNKRKKYNILKGEQK